MKESVFKNKNFTLVFLGSLVSNIGALLYSFAVSFYILSLTNTNSFIQGLYLALTGLTYVLISPLGGVIADKFNKAKIMYIFDYLRGGLILLSTLIIFLFDSNVSLKIIMLFIVGILGNVIGAIFSPASSSLLPLIVKDEQLQEANSYFSILSSFQSIVGILLAGILYSFVNIYVLFLIVGICYLLSAISEMFIKYEHKKSEEPLSVKGTLKDIKDGFLYLYNEKAIFTIVALVLLINFFFSPIFDNAIPFIVESDFTNQDYLFSNLISPELYSSFFSIIFSLGSLIAGIVISRIQIKKYILVNKISMSFLAFVTLLFSISYYVFVTLNDSLNSFIIASIIIMFLLGIGLVFVNVPVNVVFQQKVSRDMLGKVDGVLNMGSQGLIPLATFLAGVAISTLGVSSLLFICAGGFVILSIVYILNKNVDKL